MRGGAGRAAELRAAVMMQDRKFVQPTSPAATLCARHSRQPKGGPACCRSGSGSGSEQWVGTVSWAASSGCDRLLRYVAGALTAPRVSESWSFRTFSVGQAEWPPSLSDMIAYNLHCPCNGLASWQGPQCLHGVLMQHRACLASSDRPVPGAVTCPIVHRASQTAASARLPPPPLQAGQPCSKPCAPSR